MLFWAADSNSSSSYYTVYGETHLFGRSAVIRILGSQVKLVDFLITCVLRKHFLVRSAAIRLLQSRTRRAPHFLIDLRSSGLLQSQFWAADSSLSISVSRVSFFGRSWPPTLLQSHVDGRLVALSTCGRPAWAGGVFQPTAVGPTFQVLLVS